MANGVEIRPPAVAGTFYPGDKKGLSETIEQFFSNTKRSSDKKIRALIIPHAGYIYSGQTAAWGYRQLGEKEKNHFVLIGPSHSYYFPGLAASATKYWETPLGRIKQVSRPDDKKNILSNDSSHLHEHCLEVQLPFLQYLYHDFSISAFLTGAEIDYNSASNFFLANYPQSTFIISSDLSHYLSEKEAREKDKKTIGALLKIDLDYFKKEENTACGKEGILIGLTMAKRMGWRGKLIYYDTSATASKDTGAVVGYAAIGFYDPTSSRT